MATARTFSDGEKVTELAQRGKLAEEISVRVDVSQILTRRTDVLTYKNYRQEVARSLLLGLEILVAADVIRTVALEPTLPNVLILGLLVVIRTFLGWSLVVEIEEQEEETFRQATRGRPSEQTKYLKETRSRFTLTWKLNVEALSEAEREDGVFPLLTNDRKMSAVRPNRPPKEMEEKPFFVGSKVPPS